MSQEEYDEQNRIAASLANYSKQKMQRSTYAEFLTGALAPCLSFIPDVVHQQIESTFDQEDYDQVIQGFENNPITAEQFVSKE